MKKGLDSCIRWNKTLDIILSVILSPSTWYNQNDISVDVDNILYKLIDQYENGECSVYLDDYTTHFNFNNSSVEIWTSNYPYSYGYIWRINSVGGMGSKKLSPTRYTRILFKRYLDKIMTQRYNSIFKKVEDLQKDQSGKWSKL